jgi:DNA polymerase-3 subunit gamma/tau
MLVRRDSRTGANDLHTVYRPCTVDEVLGNTTNTKIIRKGLDDGSLSHAFLFTGDAGCGKTTAARIIALSLNCEKNGPSSKPCLECASCRSILNHNSLDVMEINAGSTDGGKGRVEMLAKDLPSSPFMSKYKVVIFDEAHEITSGGQNLLLKVIEDGYAHVYFIFATNKPDKLIGTFLDRCSIMHFGRISQDLIHQMLLNVAEFEAMEYNPGVLSFISEEARGVPRNALVWLKQAADEGSWTIEAVKGIIDIALDADDPQIIEISKNLIKGNFKPAWQLYDKVKKKAGAESVRIGIMSYFVGCLKRATTYLEGNRFSEIVDILSNPIYEKGMPGDYKLINYLFKVTRVMKGQ